MDQFGIGAGVVGAVEVYCSAARRTGRTTLLVESVKDGDRVIFATQAEAARVARLIRERGLKGVECIVIKPDTPHKVFEHGTPKGRCIFDHGWLESFYLDGLKHLRAEIDKLEREGSGYGAAHRKTARRAQEIAKWGGFCPSGD